MAFPVLLEPFGLIGLVLLVDLPARYPAILALSAAGKPSLANLDAPKAIRHGHTSLSRLIVNRWPIRTNSVARGGLLCIGSHFLVSAHPTYLNFPLHGLIISTR